MRFRLLRRRLTLSAPRMAVRSAMPWPLRWAGAAIVLGFCAAIALWAFEFGKNIAGLDRHSADELQALRIEVAQLRGEREKAISIANTAQSLLTTEKTVQDKLAQQLKLAEAENLELKAPGQLRFQLLAMQAGKRLPEFNGRYDVTLSGTLDGKPWVFARPGGAQALQLKQYARVEGVIDHPPQAVVKAVSVRVMDLNGVVRASLTVKP